MNCKACFPGDITYKIKFMGEKNSIFISFIRHYLTGRKQLIKHQGNVLIVKEEAVPGLVDFIFDHMQYSEVYFALDDNVWRPIKEITTIFELQWVDQIITNQLVTTFAQPIVDRNEEVYGYEMLSRFKRDDKEGYLAPFEVFQAAKIRNRMYALDKVCRMTAVRNAAKLQKKVFINFIPTAIYSPQHCLKSTVQLAQELGINPSLFVFEVVETEEVEDMDHLKNILMYYKEKGFEYALDDVGEGFSTKEVLEELAPNYMKLDMKYVQGVSNDQSKQLTAKKFLNSAKTVGSVPLAEGVELREDFEWLKKEGYQLFQGYLFGKPAPIV
ncbi:EAL domain-containing protein [Lysinibacillus antri]|uniref:EAL domain-containing protein n=1 Tax=Lysinibacillus antri TaxID=2498145 RepID=A0A432LC72_9BACI|nr:EAL domain-containing protein [Lysinibacillus antri]RUL53203.1 EAL domain-containing protein [Lysinibacillus antri]